MTTMDSSELGNNVTYNVTGYGDDNSTPMLRSFGRKADQFRHWLATRCCACLASVPSFALVIVAVVLVMLLISSIPLAFALAYVNPAPTSQNVAKLSHPAIRDGGGVWPKNDNIVKDSNAIPHVSSLLPPNITSCRDYGFACTNEPGMVIGTHQRCDGVAQCKDGSDEMDCHVCHTGFSCPVEKGDFTRLQCLRGDKLCDGIVHCADGSDEDETHCRKKCRPDEFRCASGDRCLPMSFRCDGDPHCADESDEIDCKKCTNGAKMCEPLKRCIPKWSLCDGVIDCPDGSDEMGCDCKSCSGSGKVLCGEGEEKMCLQRSKICDGVPDCPKGEDEENCPGSCNGSLITTASSTSDDPSALPLKKKMVKCADGKEYDWKLACGGTMSVCEDSCDDCNLETSISCKSNSSPSGLKCVHRSKLCDGKQQCDDGKDEANCDCNAEGMTKCKSKSSDGKTICFSKDQRCDGFQDCPGEGEDERDCEKCSNGGFLCKKDKVCVRGDQRCDGITDCPSGEDELNCTCTECQKQPQAMYMCSSGDRCFRMSDVCSPYSLCPNADKRDKLFCASRSAGAGAVKSLL